MAARMAGLPEASSDGEDSALEDMSPRHPVVLAEAQVKAAQATLKKTIAAATKQGLDILSTAVDGDRVCLSLDSGPWRATHVNDAPVLSPLAHAVSANGAFVSAPLPPALPHSFIHDSVANQAYHCLPEGFRAGPLTATDFEALAGDDGDEWPCWVTVLGQLIDQALQGASKQERSGDGGFVPTPWSTLVELNRFFDPFDEPAAMHVAAAFGRTQAQLGVPFAVPPSVINSNNVTMSVRFAPALHTLRAWVEALPALEALAKSEVGAVAGKERGGKRVTIAEAVAAFADALSTSPFTLSVCEGLTRWAQALALNRDAPTLHMLPSALRYLAACCPPALDTVRPDNRPTRYSRSRPAPRGNWPYRPAPTYTAEQEEAVAAETASFFDPLSPSDAAFAEALSAAAARAASDDGAMHPEEGRCFVKRLAAAPTLLLAEVLGVTYLDAATRPRDEVVRELVAAAKKRLPKAALPKAAKTVAGDDQKDDETKEGSSGADSSSESESGGDEDSNDDGSDDDGTDEDGSDAEGSACSKTAPDAEDETDPLLAEARAFYDEAATALTSGTVGPSSHWYRDFWGLDDRRTRFPTVWALARRVLAQPAAAVPSWSLFTPYTAVYPPPKPIEEGRYREDDDWAPSVSTSRRDVANIAKKGADREAVCKQAHRNALVTWTPIPEEEGAAGDEAAGVSAAVSAPAALRSVPLPLPPLAPGHALEALTPQQAAARLPSQAACKAAERRCNWDDHRRGAAERAAKEAYADVDKPLPPLPPPPAPPASAPALVPGAPATKGTRIKQVARKAVYAAAPRCGVSMPRPAAAPAPVPAPAALSSSRNSVQNLLAVMGSKNAAAAEAVVPPAAKRPRLEPPASASPPAPPAPAAAAAAAAAAARSYTDSDSEVEFLSSSPGKA